MGKNKDRILDVLKTSKYGLSIKKIAENLGWSRTTVTKYLNQLKDEGTVFSRDIGQYKLWIYNSPNGMNLSGDANLLLNAYTLFLKKLHELHPEIEDGKEIGKLIAIELDIESYITLDFEDLFEGFDLKQIAKTLMDVLNNIYFITYEKYNFDPPMISEDLIVLRIRDSNYIEVPLHFDILVGFMEEKIKQLFKIDVDINIKRDLEEKIVDIYFKLKK